MTDRLSGADGSLRFLALGDSYSVGEAVSPSESWPAQCAGEMRKAGMTVDDPVIIAQTGWTTDELLEGIAASDPVGPFDLVSLLIGVNNLYRGRSAEDYRVEFRSLLQLALRLGGGNPRAVVVLSIPDWGATKFAEGKDRVQIAAETDRFNAVNRREANERGVHYVDVTGESRKALLNPSLLAPDGLHPSGRMYAVWAKMVLHECFPGQRTPAKKSG